jgi:superfamily II DNA/RNA helicase
MLAGFMSAEQRRNTLSLFHRGQLAVLVTTSLLAWGIDEAKVSRVVNFDFPVHQDTGLADAEMFLRRVGRAGRFGRPGIAISIVTCEAEMCMLEDVMMQWGCSIEPII